MQDKGRTSHFMLGLFVTVGSLIGLAAVIWLGASQYFQRGERYVTYFDESVQGLSVDSGVKYRGVEVGRVEKIGIAPDNNLIEVVMKIDMSDELAHETVAQLKAVGITGLVFIELNRQQKNGSNRPLQVAFSAPYPVIPSIASDSSRIFSALDEVARRISELNVKDALNGITSLVKRVDLIASDAKLQNIVTNLDSATAGLKDTTREIEKAMTQTQMSLAKADMLIDESRRALDDMNLPETAAALKKTIAEMEGALAETRLLVAGSRHILEEMKLPERAKQADTLMEDLDYSTRRAARGITDASEGLQRALVTFEGLMQRLNRNPSDLIFSTPPDTEEGEEEAEP